MESCYHGSLKKRLHMFEVMLIASSNVKMAVKDLSIVSSSLCAQDSKLESRQQVRIQVH